MNTSAISSNKQRGVYSEIINPDNSALYQNTNAGKPDDSLYINTQQRQKIPRANGLKSKAGVNQTASFVDKKKAKEKL